MGRDAAPTRIRLATTEDAAAMSELVHSLSAKYIAIDFDEMGARRLLASMEAPAIREYLRSGYRYHIAEEDGILLGVVGVRENKHLYHLFVTEARQRQGLATKLWRVARAACIAAGNAGEFTVNASRLAVSFYERLGFVQIGPPQNRDGGSAIPMKLIERNGETTPQGGERPSAKE